MHGVDMVHVTPLRTLASSS